MKIAIVGDKFSINQGTGISRYLLEVSRRLSKKFDVEIIGSNPKNSLHSLIDHLSLTPIKVLKKKNDFDIFHAIAPVNSIFVPFLKNKATVITYHDISPILYGKNRSFHVKATAPLFYRTGKFCTKVITNSTLTKYELLNHLSFPEKKIHMINLGVDEKFKPKIKEDQENLIIGYIGALNSRKRIDSLIKSFYYLKNKELTSKAHLKIYGVGEEYINLNKLVNKLKIEDVEFCGFIEDNMIVDVYNSFDVFVMPSTWEGFGLPILEAQRCGVPVIIRRDASIPLEVSKYCIKADSVRDMASKIYEIFNNDVLKKELINDGIKHSEEFTWDKTVDKTINVYKMALEEENN